MVNGQWWINGLGVVVRTKIVVGNIIQEQVRYFNRLGCDISYEYDKDVQTKKEDVDASTEQVIEF